MEGKPLDIVDQTKLLGLIVSNDLTWSRNTQYIIKRANFRMELLRRISNCNALIKDLVQIYHIYKKHMGRVLSNLAWYTYPGRH